MKHTSLYLAILACVLIGLAVGCTSDPAQTIGELLATQPSASPFIPLISRSTASSTPTVVEITPNQSATPAPVTPTVTPQPTSALGVDPASLGGSTVRMWHPWNGEMERALQELADEYNASNEWGISLQVEGHGSLDDLAADVEAAAQTGEPPDLAAAFLYQALNWDDRIELVDWNPYLNDPEWGLSTADQDDFHPVFWDQGILEGRRVGIPALGSGQVLYYNQSWAQELGFSTPPTNAEEFRQQACAAAQSSQGENKEGGWIISTGYSAALGWIQAFGGEIVRPHGGESDSSVYQFDTEPVRDAFTYLRGLFDQGCAWLAEDIETEQAFAQRQGLFATGSMIDLPYLGETMNRQGRNDQWTVIPFPAAQGLGAINAYGPQYVMLSASPDQRLAAWLFLRWLLSAPNQARLTQASGSFPLRRASLAAMQDYNSQHPQWSAAVDLLDLAHPEPPYPSWIVVRWALSDALTQLFRSYFTIDQVPQLARFLEQTAADLFLAGKETISPAAGFPTPTVSGTPVSDTPTP